jgi:hypothetical protein
MGLFLSLHRPQLDHCGTSRRLGQRQQDLAPVLRERRHPRLSREDDIPSCPPGRGPGLVQEREPGEREVEVTRE